MNTPRRHRVPPAMKFALDHGIDRILSALAAFALYRVTPVNHGAWTWAGALAILGCVLYAVRPE